ncbi:MAG: ATP-binding cassette domain-containing protein [Gammaproteobacteria bacterium]|nr:ATP-binding cassette domain-containing protein [Gammaproteobacteria bacterium]
MENILIQAKGIRQCNENIYSQFDIAIMPGTMTSIIGPESADKSIWLKILAGLEDFEGGELELMGKNINSIGRQGWLDSRKKIAYVGTSTALLSVLNIMDNIVTPALYHKQGSTSQLEERALGLLSQIGYTDFQSLQQLPAYVDAEKRYQALLVRAMMLEPKVIFIDNLFSRIGVQAKQMVRTFLENQMQKNNLAVVLNTRNIEFACRYSDTIVFVSPSNMLVFNNENELQQSPDPDVSDFLKNYYMN